MQVVSQIQGLYHGMAGMYRTVVVEHDDDADDVLNYLNFDGEIMICVGRFNPGGGGRATVLTTFTIGETD